MRIAVLVLASAAPNGLAAMAQALQHDDISIFVHVDKKLGNDYASSFNAVTDIVFIEERYNIYWGGFNMVLAEIALLQRALLGNYDRYVLVSDNSFPLKPCRELLAAFAVEQQWIGFEAKPGGWPRSRYEPFYYLDSTATDRRGSVSELGAFKDDDLDNLLALAYLIGRGKKKIETFYFGSQWWALTGQAARYVIDVHRTDHHLRDSFRFSEIPDEHYIQTIVGNAPEQWKLRNTHMWTDFDREPKPYIFSSLEEIRLAQESEYLFIRKVSNEQTFLATLLDDLEAKSAATSPSAPVM